MPKLASVALRDLIPNGQAAKEFLIDELLVRVQQRVPVDTGLAQRSLFRDYEQGILTLDDIGKTTALEFGHSGQAPRGFLRITASEAPEILSRFEREGEQ